MVVGQKAVRHRKTVSHPERLIPLAFLIGIAAGTLLLMLPVSRAGSTIGDGGTSLITALFTATSALCVTGLTVVDTPTFWTPFGQFVIIALCQVGGFGIMTGATLLGLFANRQMKLSGKLLACAEMRSLDLGDVKGVVRLVLILSLSVEGALALWLTVHFWAGVGMAPLEAAWHGVFHAVSAFNNAGFSTLPDGMLPYARDPWMLSPLMIGVVLGGIGFPVLHELKNEWRHPAAWSIHTKLTLYGTIGLTVAGMLAVLLFERTNGATLGEAGLAERLLGALFHSVMTRSGGFNVHDTGAMHAPTHLLSTGLMLIGGGSASTAGGIRITTFLLLGYVVWAEVRGQPDAVAFRRRIAPETQRQAFTIVIFAVGVLSVALLALTTLVDAPVEHLLFDAVSAFGTVGLSTGATAAMPPEGQFIQTLLMYIGRVGTVSLATAVALKVRSTPYRYPEERPIVG